MKVKTLTPIREKPDYYVGIEREIMDIFKREIYLPLIMMIGLKKNKLTNSTDDLLEAIRSGRIVYSRGHFEGRFDAVTSRELKNLGATWDRKHSSFKINKSELPIEMINTILLSESKFRDTLSKIDRKLASVIPAEFAENFKLDNLFDTTLFKIEKDFKKSIQGITIAPQTTPEERKRIADEYTKNIQLYIQDFTEKETVKLRTEIQESAFGGFRYESMIKKIKESYGVSVNKAKFLARQETSLMLTKYQQVRYQSAGVEEYKWTCVNMPHQRKNGPYKKGEVRYDHGILNGKIFRWDSPPVVNEKGDRKNPGQDYNCRCFATPIVKF